MACFPCVFYRWREHTVMVHTEPGPWGRSAWWEPWTRRSGIISQNSSACWRSRPSWRWVRTGWMSAMLISYRMRGYRVNEKVIEVFRFRHYMEEQNNLQWSTLIIPNTWRSYNVESVAGVNVQQQKLKESCCTWTLMLIFLVIVSKSGEKTETDILTSCLWPSAASPFVSTEDVLGTSFYYYSQHILGAIFSMGFILILWTNEYTLQ